jgi:hypothetical protein
MKPITKDSHSNNIHTCTHPCLLVENTKKRFTQTHATPYFNTTTSLSKTHKFFFYIFQFLFAHIEKKTTSDDFSQYLLKQFLFVLCHNLLVENMKKNSYENNRNENK